MKYKIKAVLLVLTFLCITYVLATSYGKFQVMVTSLEACKGPRRKDCARTVHHLQPGGLVMQIFMEVLDTAQLDMIRILGYRSDYQKNSAPMIEIKLDNPCQYPLLKAFLPDVTVKGKLCFMVKGLYNYTVDSRHLTKALWADSADSFFYGNFSFKGIVFGRNCNFDCTLVNVTFTPKDT